MSKKLLIEKKLWTPGLRILKNKIAVRVHCPWTPWRQTSIFTVHDGSWHKPIKKLQLQKRPREISEPFTFILTWAAKGFTNLLFKMQAAGRHILKSSGLCSEVGLLGSKPTVAVRKKCSMPCYELKMNLWCKIELT